MRDRIPVGIVRQVRGGVGAEYEIIGIGQVLAWEGGFFSIQILNASSASTAGDVVAGAGLEDPPPVSDEDARRRVVRSIVARRGQARFRQALLAAYAGRCVISGCDVEAVLEAAHIVRYLGDHTDVVTNGLLLRGDLHTLFDLGLLRIEPAERRVVLNAALRASEYGPLHGRVLSEPVQAGQRPAPDVLERAWEQASVNGDLR
jgi:hypothetical protein